MPITPLVRDVILGDGSSMRLRAPRLTDYEDIKAFYDGLSPASRYKRFHGMARTDVAARLSAEAGGVDRVALIGRHGDRIVAAANYDLLREPGAAEVAFAVADDFRRRGTATRLLEQLAAVAAEHGVRRFDAEVLVDNVAMISVFMQAGFAVRRHGIGGEITVSLDIRPTETVRERIDERDHRGAVASLRPVLSPASIAVVGASDITDDPGAAVLANVINGGFLGVAMPVSAGGGVIRSMRAARSVGELPEVPELVVIAVPATEVVDVARDAAEKGAKALVVLSGGMADAGEEGREREEQLLETVRAAGMRMIGPNCLGILNTDPAVRLNATSAGLRVSPGRLAICSQSGAIGIGLLGHAAARRLGVSSFASLGNRADVSTNDLLELWEEDVRTAVVMLYVESFGNPERFARIARRVARRKPILAVKGHRRPEAAPSEAQTHTAAALRGDAVVDALLTQAGVQRFRSGEQLFNAAEFFERQPLPAGRRIGIVSNSAGVATLAADACGTRGLVVAQAQGPIANPLVLDIRTGSEHYVTGVRGMLRDPGIDGVMAFYVDPQGGNPEGVLEAVSLSAAAQAKPVVASVVTGDGGLPDGRVAGIPNYRFPESCADVLARGAERRDWLSRPVGERPHYEDVDPDAARELIGARLAGAETGQAWLSITEAETLLGTHRLPVVPTHPCTDPDQAVALAAQIDAPIALKADLAPPARAGDIGAVLLELEGESAVRAGWQELERRVQSAGATWRGALVQRLVPSGADVLVGTVTDPELGPVMAIGLGGRQAELRGSVACRIAPVTDVDADELIDGSEAVAMQLDGFRGAPRLDRDALRELVLRFALLLAVAPEVVEADLNPVRCLTDGCVVLDARLRLEPARPSGRVKTW